MAIVTECEAGIEIAAKVVPGASKSRIAGQLGDALKIQVAAPPEKGKANGAVEALIAAALGVPARQVSVVAGMTSPRKTLRVLGVALEHARAVLKVE